MIFFDPEHEEIWTRGNIFSTQGSEQEKLRNSTEMARDLTHHFDTVLFIVPRNDGT